MIYINKIFPHTYTVNWAYSFDKNPQAIGVETEFIILLSFDTGSPIVFQQTA